MKVIVCPCGYTASYNSFALLSLIRPAWKCPKCGAEFIVPGKSLIDIVVCVN